MTGRRAAIVGLAGEMLGADEIALFRDAPPLGVCLFRRNVPEGGTPARLADTIRSVLGDRTLVMVDQEGGRVARLRPPRFAAHPPAAAIGAAHARDPVRGERAAFLTGALIGLDARDAGCDLVAAPVLDRQVAGADAVIGDRAFSADADAVATLGAALADGLLASGCQPVGKHAPGHGRATLDSHRAMPELDGIGEADLVPFRRLASRLGWMMTAHILYRRDDPDAPATLSAAVIEGAIRGAIGFRGVLVSDDLAMGALAGDAGARARRAIEAGCDVALHCSGVLSESAAVLHATPTVSGQTSARLDAAWRSAFARRLPLDRETLLGERDALLG